MIHGLSKIARNLKETSNRLVFKRFQEKVLFLKSADITLFLGGSEVLLFRNKRPVKYINFTNIRTFPGVIFTPPFPSSINFAIFLNHLKKQRHTPIFKKYFGN